MLRRDIPALGEPTYEAYDHVRRQVADLVDQGVLAVCGEVPLEAVDLRYERVPQCDLCGATTGHHPVTLWKYGTPVVRCTTCGLLYANPRWKAEHLFGRYTHDYWAHYSDTVHGTSATREAAAIRQAYYLSTFERALGTAGTLLDVGCATGEFLAAARSRGWRVYGVESSPQAADAARRSTSAEIHTGTLDSAPFADGAFDAITMFEVIEHLQSPRSYIEIIARLLRPGGVFALSTPNIRSIAFWLLGRHWHVIGPNDHLYYFSPSTLRRLLTAHGFSIHEMRSELTNAAVWQQALRFGFLAPLGKVLAGMSTPLVTRFMLGDGLSVLGQLTGR